MELKQASRSRAKIKMALQGPSGSGKTFSALLIAHGLCQDWTKVAVVDTENHSANLYAHLGRYNVVNLDAPFTPEKYNAAIDLCVQAGMEVIILDSISHEWEGSGGILDIHGALPGNSFTNWSKVIPRHNAFVQHILQSPVHIVSTIRTKQDYVLQEKNGKMVPEKVGLKGVTREGLDYEFTLVFDLDIKHHATASKDRTNLFSGAPDFRIIEETGRMIADWCDSHTDTQPGNPDKVQGEEPGRRRDISGQIQACMDVEALKNLFTQLSPSEQLQFREQFVTRKSSLLGPATIENPLTHLNPAQQNGSTHH